MARCPICGTVAATGSLCSVLDSDEFAIPGAGSAASPHQLDPIEDGDADNLLACGVDGISAILPTSLTDPPSCRAFHSANQSIPNNTLTTVALNLEQYDTDTMHDLAISNSRVTFTTAGKYIVTFNGVWDKHATGDRMAQVRKNGTDILAFESKRTGGADLYVGHSIVVQDSFAAADYVEARVQQTRGAALLLIQESYSPFLAATRVGPV